LLDQRIRGATLSTWRSKATSKPKVAIACVTALYTIGSVVAYWSYGRLLGIVASYVDVFNLLDRKASDIDYFYASRLQGEPAQGVDDVHFHPVESRALPATLAVTF